MRSHGSQDFENLERLLEAVFTICAMHPTLQDRHLDELLVEARKRGRRRVSVKNSRQNALDFNALGLVIHRWRRSPKYLSENGEPLALEARGKGPSIQSLFREVRRSDYFIQGFKQLQRMRHIAKTKSGRFLPRDLTIIVPTLTPELFDVLVLTIRRLVATVVHNTSQRGAKSDRLIERMTYVPDLPKRQLAAFKKFSREQGSALVDTMDDWLESRRAASRRATKSSSRAFAAGCHLFCFVEE